MENPRVCDRPYANDKKRVQVHDDTMVQSMIRLVSGRLLDGTRVCLEQGFERVMDYTALEHPINAGQDCILPGWSASSQVLSQAPPNVLTSV